MAATRGCLHDRACPMVCYLPLVQMKGMKEEKQELLRQLEELCVENGNLQVHSPEELPPYSTPGHRE